MAEPGAGRGESESLLRSEGSEEVRLRDNPPSVGLIHWALTTGLQRNQGRPSGRKEISEVKWPLQTCMMSQLEELEPNPGLI